MTAKKLSIIPLHNAVKHGDIQMVIKLITKGDSILAVDTDKNTPLHLSHLLNQEEITDYILSHIKLTHCYDQNPKNSCGLTHLHVACARGNSEAVINFELAGANVKDVVGRNSPLHAGYSCLELACESKSLETVAVIVKVTQLLYSCLDAKQEEFSCMMSLQGFDHYVIEMHHNCDYFGDKKMLMSDLQRACFYGQVNKVESLLEKGEDVDEVMSKSARASPLYSPLHFAIEAHENRQETLEMLLAYGADVSWKNGFCMTPLHLAMYKDNHRESKCSLDANRLEDDTLKILYKTTEDKEKNPMDAFGLTYFHVAVACNDVEMVRKFIDKNEGDYKPILPNLKNFSMYTPLHFAVKYGNEDMARLLVDHGANINANEDEDCFLSPLQVAINYGQHRMINFLLANGANAKVVTHDCKRTTLHLLVERFGDYKDEKPQLLGYVEKLFERGVNVDAKDSIGDTALHNACWNLNDKLEILYELVTCGADINVKNNNGETAFDAACADVTHTDYSTYFKIYLHVQKLIDFGFKVDERNEKVCDMIMNMMEDWKDTKDWPAIEKMTSNEELSRRHQERLSEIERLKCDMLDEKTSMCDYLKMDINEASKYAENERIKELVADKQLKNLYENYGYMIPVMYKKSLCCLRNREHKKKNMRHASTQTVSPKEQSSATEIVKESMPADATLHSVIRRGNVEWTKELLRKGASMKRVDSCQNSPLHLAFLLQRDDIVDVLLAHMHDTSFTDNLQNSMGLTHLHVAAARGNAAFVQRLIDAKANPSDFVSDKAPIFAGRSVLQFACDSKSLKTLQIVTNIVEFFSRNIPSRGSLPTFARSMIERCHKRGKFDSERLSDFHAACFLGKLGDVEGFLQRGAAADANAAMNRETRFTPLYTALHFAVESEIERRQKVELLLKHGADPSRKNGFGMTALHLAMYDDDSDDEGTAKMLYELAEDKEANPMDAFGLTYLHVAVAQNDVPLVKKMLLNGEDVNRYVLPNIRNFRMYTPLHFAIKYGHAEMIEVLIERGANVNANEDDLRFETPLQLAIKRGTRRAIDVLLEHNANAKVVQAADAGASTTIHLLIKRFAKISRDSSEGHELDGLIEKLAKLGADADAKDACGSTALHSACRQWKNCSALVEELLVAGADVNAKNVLGETPLDVVCRCESLQENIEDLMTIYQHVQRLKDLGLSVDPRSKRFFEIVAKQRKICAEYFDDVTYSDEEMARMKQKRSDEIRRLKADMITDEVSLYEYLRMSPERAAAHATNERIRGIVDDEPKVLYEVYGYLVAVVYRKSLKWLESGGNSTKKTGKKTHRGKRRRA